MDQLSPINQPRVNKVWYLQHIDIFHGMAREDLEAMAQHMRDHRFMRRDVIIAPGDRGDKVYLLKDGTVKISQVTESGKEAILAIVSTGEVFGENALFRDEVRDVTATAMEDSLVCVVSSEKFRHFLEMHPNLSTKILIHAGDRARELEQRIIDIAFRTVNERLAILLLTLAQRFEIDPHTHGELIDLPLTHQEVANLIGATRESTSLAISELRHQGLIETDQHRFVIRDREGLRGLVRVN